MALAWSLYVFGTCVRGCVPLLYSSGLDVCGAFCVISSSSSRMSFELFSWKYMIRNFLNVSQLWTSKVLHHRSVHQPVSQQGRQPSRPLLRHYEAVFFGGKTLESERVDGTWVNDSFGGVRPSRASSVHRISMYPSTWCSAQTRCVFTLYHF